MEILRTTSTRLISPTGGASMRAPRAEAGSSAGNGIRPSSDPLFEVTLESTNAVPPPFKLRDPVEISDDARQALEQAKAPPSEEDAEAMEEGVQKPDPMGAKATDGQALSERDAQRVRELKIIDAKVHAHENAHLAAGGGYASAPNYQYTQGPDGRRYAIGGEVRIDASPERSPEETIIKMQVVRAAALAPSDPSPQDRAVAAVASQHEQAARGEAAQQKAEEVAEKAESPEETSATDPAAEKGAEAATAETSAVSGKDATPEAPAPAVSTTGGVQGSATAKLSANAYGRFSAASDGGRHLDQHA